VAAALQVAEHHDATEVSDMQAVGSGVSSQVSRCHAFHQKFFRSWHDLCEHATPFQFFYKIHLSLSLLISYFQFQATKVQ
jgi:hypothetical protein